MANNPQSTGMQHVQPHINGPVPPPPIPLPPMPMQFRPGVPPPPPPQPFVPVAPQPFQSGGHANLGMAPHPPQIQYPPPAPPQIHNFSGHGPPQGPTVPPPDFLPNRTVMSASAQPQVSTNFVPSYGGPRVSNIPYNLSSSSGGQQHTVQHFPMPPAETSSFSAGGKPWFPSGNQNMQSALTVQQAGEQNAGEQSWFSSGAQNTKPATPLQKKGEQNTGTQQWFPNGNQTVQYDTPSRQSEVQTAAGTNNPQPDCAKNTSSDWIVHTSREGKKYYYNRKTRISSWEKPYELMTPTERADASTDWREISTPEGRRFYYNKVTKQSKWAMPDAVKLSRERANVGSCEGISTKDSCAGTSTKDVNSCASAAISVSGNTASTSNANNLSFSSELVPSPVPVTPTPVPELAVASGSSSVQEETADLKSDAAEIHTPVEVATSVGVLDSPVRIAAVTGMVTPTRISNMSPQDTVPSSAKTSPENVEEANTSSGVSGSGGTNVLDEKKVEHGPLVYESKEEAKNAFKDLLETANVGPDWNWEQAMRVIINDRRYGALRTLGERKQTFNEFVGQKKKQEAEERRTRQKKARENFKKMLQESKDLTSSMRWSKIISMFENDDRFHAIEWAKDREDLFEDHIEDLKKKERTKALEDRKRQQTEYLNFLKSCDFIKASSQWRKVQHRLEADERCSCLEKIERLEIFQEYIRDLEMEEEEQRKLRIEELRKAERRNRDEFRKLMEEHVADGTLTANSHWREYCMKVKDAPAYLAVSSNASGSTAKDLFDDVIDDLEKQYLEDKEKIEEFMKNEKISLSTTWTFEDFKDAITKVISSKPISNVNLKLAFEELLEITKEREEKETKKRKRLTEEVYEFLFSHKEIAAYSSWEDCKPLIKERFVGDEGFFREIFDKFILEVKEKAKDKERKRKEEKAKKEKERRDKEKNVKDRKHRDRGVDSRKSKERYKMDETDSDKSESYNMEENRRSRDRNRKHHKRVLDSASWDDDEKDHPKSLRHNIDSKRSKQMERQAWGDEVDSGSQHKRRRGDHWDSSSRITTDPEEYKDTEDGEVW